MLWEGVLGDNTLVTGLLDQPVFVMVDATDMPVGVRKDIHIKFASYSPPRKRKIEAMSLIPC